MFKHLALVSSLALVALVARDASAEPTCTATGCSAYLDDTSNDIRLALYTTYAQVTAYYGNYASSCTIWSSDANFARISQILAAAQAAKTTGALGTFKFGIGANSVCTSASIVSWR